MREMEFLPDWYPQLRRRKRRLKLQGWLALIAAGSLVLWVLVLHRNVQAAQATQEKLQRQLADAAGQVEHVQRLESLEWSLRQQEEVQNRLGANVQTARLLGTISSLMPVSTSLLELEVQTPTSTRAIAGMPQTLSDRRLHVRLAGVAPTDVDLATFISELNKVPFFDNVAPSHFREMKKDGHVMRKFELTFTVNLDASAGS